MKFEHRETEVAFIIISSNQPVRSLRKIAEVNEIGNYRLRPRLRRAIHDRYFDTPDRLLESTGLALRLRKIDKTKWLTLKSDARPTAWGGVDRKETEIRWSRRGLQRIVKKLNGRGINLRSPREVDRTRPVVILKKLGLTAIQDRVNRRIVRDVIRSDDKKVVVRAELAIDSVVYHFPKQDIRFDQVEIESKCKIGPAVVNAVAKSLILKFGPLLRPWNYGKLSTGKAIEKMLAQGSLKGFLTGDNHLKQSAFDKIAHYLSTGNI